MSKAEGQPKKQLLRTRADAKRAMTSSRSLVASLHAIEELMDKTDYYGRVRWQPSERREDVAREVNDLIALARADYPDQEIEVNVVVHVPQTEGKDTDTQGGNSNGR